MGFVYILLRKQIWKNQLTVKQFADQILEADILNENMVAELR